MYENQYTTILNLLREKRVLYGKTQKEIAESLNKPQSFVSKYEKGQRKLDLAEFIHVCRAIGIDTSSFIKEIERLLDGSE